MTIHKVSLILVCFGVSQNLLGSQKLRKRKSSSSLEYLSKRPRKLLRQDSAPHGLVRSVPTNISFDSFVVSIAKGNTDEVKERIKGALPFTLFRQYRLFCTIPRGNKELQDYMYKTIVSIWRKKIKKCPADAIESILREVRKIKESFGENLHYGFLILLEDLRRCALRRKRVQRNKKLYALAKQLPHFKTEQESLQARIVYFLILSGGEENIPEYLQDLVEKAYPEDAKLIPFFSHNDDEL